MARSRRAQAEKNDERGSSSQPGRAGRLERVAQVAEALRRRDDHVARGLAWLGELGVLDVESQKRLWARYQEGDQATRRLVQEQVARVLGSPEGAGGTSGGAGRAPEGASAASRAETVDPAELEVLRQLSLPQVDVKQVAQQVRRFDPARWLGDPKDPGPVLRFFSDAPLAVHRFRRRLMWTGVLLLVLVVALVALAVFVPAVVPWVGLVGVVLLAFFLGFSLLRLSFGLERLAKSQGIDLGVYAQLPDDERRILLMRRVGLRLLDPQRLGALVEEGLGHGLPKRMQADSGANRSGGPVAGPEPEATREAGADGRPIEDETSVAGVASSRSRSGIADEPGADAAPTDRPTQDSGGPGRMARFLGRAQESVKRAARSERTMKVKKEVSTRAVSAGRSARKGFEDLRERGTQEYKRRREAAGKRPSTGKKETTGKRVRGARSAKKRAAGVAKTAGKKAASKRSAKKSPKKGTKRSAKKSGKK